MGKLSNKIIVSENAQDKDPAFGKTISINDLFDGASELAKLKEVKSIEITKYSDLVVELENSTGKIHISNLTGTIIYKGDCKARHVKFAADKIKAIPYLKNVKIF